MQDLLAKERNANAEAERQIAKQKREAHMKSTLMVMEKGDAKFVKQCVWSEWKNLLPNPAGNAEVERYKQLHKDGVMHAMTQLAEHSDSAFRKEVFSMWKQIWKDEAAEQQYRHHQAEQIHNVKGKHNHVIEKAMLCWKKNDETMLLQTILHVWMQDIRDAQEALRIAAEEAERELLRRKNDSAMKGALMTLEGNNAKFLKECLFKSWRDVIEQGKSDAQSGSLVAYYKNLHKQGVMQAMERLASGSDDGLRHVCFGGWAQVIKEHLMTERQRSHMANTKSKHSHVLEKTMMQWAESVRDQAAVL